jgi:hypothetical protein
MTGKAVSVRRQLNSKLWNPQLSRRAHFTGIDRLLQVK